MKISEFLKNQGLFSNEIKDRFKSGQIKINGEILREDKDLPFKDPTPDPRFNFRQFSPNSILPPYEAGEWIFVNLITKMTPEKKKILFLFVNIFDLETIFSGGCMINDKPIEDILPELNVIKGHFFLRVSKKQSFILKLSE